MGVRNDQYGDGTVDWTVFGSGGWGGTEASQRSACLTLSVIVAAAD